jgi:hypothetical protein
MKIKAFRTMKPVYGEKTRRQLELQRVNEMLKYGELHNYPFDKLKRTERRLRGTLKLKTE